MSSYRKTKHQQLTHYDRNAHEFNMTRNLLFSCEAPTHKNDESNTPVQQKHQMQKNVVSMRQLRRSQSASGFRRSDVLQDTRDSYRGLGRNSGLFWPDAKVQQSTMVDTMSNNETKELHKFKRGFRRLHSRDRGLLLGGNIMQTAQNILGVTKHRCFPACESDVVINHAIRSNNDVRNDTVISDAVKRDHVGKDAVGSDSVKSYTVRSDSVKTCVVGRGDFRSADKRKIVTSGSVNSAAVISDADTSYNVGKDDIESDAVRIYTVGSDDGRSYTVGSDDGRSYTVGSDAVRNNTVGSNAVRMYNVESGAVRTGVVGRGDFRRSKRRNIVRSGSINSGAVRSGSINSGAVINDAVSVCNHERLGRKTLIGRSQSAGSRTRLNWDAKKSSQTCRDVNTDETFVFPVQQRSGESVKSVVVRVALGY